jgi:hypothetical protein
VSTASAMQLPKAHCSLGALAARLAAASVLLYAAAPPKLHTVAATVSSSLILPAVPKTRAHHTQHTWDCCQQETHSNVVQCSLETLVVHLCEWSNGLPAFQGCQAPLQALARLGLALLPLLLLWMSHPRAVLLFNLKRVMFKLLVCQGKLGFPEMRLSQRSQWVKGVTVDLKALPRLDEMCSAATIPLADRARNEPLLIMSLTQLIRSRILQQ